MMSASRHSTRLIIGVFLTGIPLAFGFQAKWKGSIKTENGVMVVRNPRIPMYAPDALELRQDLVIGRPGGPAESLFSDIRQVAVDGEENIYVLDSKESHIEIFSIDGRHLRTIGRKGQGPGELDNPRTISIFGGEIMVTEASRRLSFFSQDGTFLRTLSTKEIWALMAECDSKGNILVTTASMDPKDLKYKYLKFDGQMNLLFEIASSPAPNALKGFNPFMAVSYMRVGWDDQIIYGYPEDYTIQVISSQGKLIRKITREYEPVAVTEEEKKEQTADAPPSIKFDFSKYHSAFRRFAFDDAGRIFVQSWEKNAADGSFLYDIFDAKGRYLVKIPIKGRPFVGLKGKLYASDEDEEGNPLVIRYRLVWKIPA
jgi:hypothetical protein